MFSAALLWKQGAPGSAAFGNIEWLLVRVTQLASRANQTDRQTDIRENSAQYPALQVGVGEMVVGTEGKKGRKNQALAFRRTAVTRHQRKSELSRKPPKKFSPTFPPLKTSYG